jgi:hypothetical protein
MNGATRPRSPNLRKITPRYQALPGVRAILLFFFIAHTISETFADAIDLSAAVIVTDSSQIIHRNAAEMLRDEISSRTRIRLAIEESMPTQGQVAIVLDRIDGPLMNGRTVPAAFPVPDQPEGYSIWVDSNNGETPTVCLAGRDARGVLYAVGRLLRNAEMGRDQLRLESAFGIATAPEYPLRGHQLGYRPKTNSYDGFTVEMWHQYIRELIVFGINAIELVPPKSDDNDDSRHFPLSQLDMMVEMSRIANSYGLDVWIWYPIIDDNQDAKTVERAIRERDLVFRSLPRIDVVFVPGGDPGEVNPEQLFASMSQQHEILTRYHGKAKIWVSPQGFDWRGYPMEVDKKIEGKGWMQLFYDILHRDQPDWLGGVVYGPQISATIAEVRANVPSRYPIRRYPDIAHTLDAQYWVPNWDPALYATLGREPINPRPFDYAKIIRDWDEYTHGFITYSEGVNDDVNKCIWASLGWDSKADVEDILREYSRYYISPRWESSFTRGLLGLEQNWIGPLLPNMGVYETLRIFQEMEKEATPAEKHNWRFQSGLYRAYYDAYIRRRLIHETEIEEQTMDALRRAGEIGSLLAVEQANAILDRTILEIVAPDWRSRVYALAEGLFQSIHLQLDVEHYEATSKRRGGNLEDIDTPINNYHKLKSEFTRIRQISSEKVRLSEIETITSERYRMKTQHDYEVIQEGIQ